MVNYACVFNQSETGKYFESIIVGLIKYELTVFDWPLMLLVICQLLMQFTRK